MVIKSKSNQSLPCVRSWILIGIPVLFVIGSLMHFAYGWSGKQAIVGIFAPVNESVWEHLKLSFWPMLIWWIVGYFVCEKKCNVDLTQWVVSAVSAMVICPLFIVAFFYTYTGAFSIESLLLDILSFLLGIAIAQLFALHLYRYAKFNSAWLLVAVVILILMLFAFIYFTFSPPHIPLFIDPETGTYGIQPA